MERLKTLGWILFIAVVLLLLFLPDAAPEDAVSRPTTENRKSSGLFALAQWLRTAGIPVHSQRDRWTRLPDAYADSTGGLAVLHLPVKLIYEAEEIRSLLRWVAAGNTLLVAAGHLEGSAWIYDGIDLQHSLWRLTGLELHSLPAAEEGDDDAADSALEPLADRLLTEANTVFETPGWMLLHDARQVVALLPADADPVTAQTAALTVPWDGSEWGSEAEWQRRRRDSQAAADRESDAASKAEQEPEQLRRPWQADLDSCVGVPSAAVGERVINGRAGCVSIPTPATAAWRTLLTHEQSAQAALTQAPLGRGQVYVLLHPSLLSNEVMFRFGNRSFAQGLIAETLTAGSGVLFDDAHQGLNDILEADDLLRDPRFYFSIAFLLALWIAYLLADSGAWQRASQREPLRALRQRDLITLAGRFLAERLRPHAAADAVVEPLRRELADKWRLAVGDALRQGLALEEARHPAAVAELMALLEQCDAVDGSEAAAAVTRRGRLPLLALHGSVQRFRQLIA